MTNMDKVEVNTKFLDAVKKAVTKHSDKDGFGYAILSQDGEIGGEKTTKIKEFTPLSMVPIDTQTSKLPIIAKMYERFGNMDFSKPKSLIAHGRFSTNTVNLPNTHPFTNENVALIHNGVVKDDATIKIGGLKTDCDTEILLRYWERGGIKDIEKNVAGYYAMAILDKAGQLHIVRDNRAPLYIAYVRNVDSYMIATTKEIIESVARSMRWKAEEAEEVLENIHAIFEGNEIVSYADISPKGGSAYEFNSKAAKAFGSEDFKSTTELTEEEVEDLADEIGEIEGVSYSKEDIERYMASQRSRSFYQEHGHKHGKHLSHDDMDDVIDFQKRSRGSRY